MPKTPPAHVVALEPHDPEWVRSAARETERLRQALRGNLVVVEHFGSTSVPGLAAKPVIDLMPLVANLQALDRDRMRVEALGYEWFGEFGISGRRFCTLTSADGVRLVHLHAYQLSDTEIGRHLAFRDFLRSHPGIARDYEREKRRAAALHPNDSLAYNEEKDAWIVTHEALALAWVAAGRPRSNNT